MDKMLKNRGFNWFLKLYLMYVCFGFVTGMLSSWLYYPSAVIYLIRGIDRKLVSAIITYSTTFQKEDFKFKIVLS